MKEKSAFLKGMRDGFPIGLGYFAVSFSLGIIAKKGGLMPVIGFFSSLFVRASAGEYAGYTSIATHASYWELVIITVIANARYLLMNCALSQKFSSATGIVKRILVGACCTDEIFGISIAWPGYLKPSYTFGATAIAGPMWALGTALGIVAGGTLPVRAVSALSVALYGMFLAIIVPPSKKDKAVAIAVAASFALSYLFSILPVVKTISAGTRTIILTIVIAAAAAILKPVPDLPEDGGDTNE
jgi:predicted branched-subunit amino acid permease